MQAVQTAFHARLLPRSAAFVLLPVRTKRFQDRAAEAPVRSGEAAACCAACEARWLAVTGKASSSSRGYGRRHRKVREQVARLIASGNARCWRCGRPILPGMLWDLGHSDVDRSRYMGPECRHCNRSAGAIKGNRMRGSARLLLKVRAGLPDSDRKRW